MSSALRLDLGNDFSIAYHASPGKSPGVVFLGGFMSDMTGTKATALEAHCRSRGRAFVRFDYFGHGETDGDFIDGTIGRWSADAIAVLDRLTEGPQILVGSSMGGWIMLLAALARPERIHALVGIAPAPDFTEDLMWDAFEPDVQTRLQSDGIIELPSDYDDGPYRIAFRLIEEGRDHLLLRQAIPLTCPVRLIHGMADSSVPWRVSLALADALDSDSVTMTLIKGSGHRLSEPDDLDRLFTALDELSADVTKT